MDQTNQNQNSYALHLKSLVEKQKHGNSSMQTFSEVLVCYLGCDSKEYYAKIKDEEGNNVKEMKDGKLVDKRADTASGYIFTFTKLGSSTTVKIVLPKKVELPLLSCWEVGGMGYDIKSGNMLFLQESTSIKPVKAD